ncbi:uncharacterized protein [Haliotis cracherodii]|uniref:uncharacterized protein n=1 Tax=Haliotis cracherodii TaxID=6455 RepID=UPI0039EC96AC
MVRVKPLTVDPLDQSSEAAHVIFNEDSAEDRVIVQTLCGGMERSGISCTYYERDGKAGRPEVGDRGSMMENAVWMIIVYLQMPVGDHDAMFAFEENMALFLAITHDVQNVIYLLGDDVEPVVSKGFPFFRMKKDKNWLWHLTGLVETTPTKITSNLFHRFYYQLVQQNGSLFPISRESLSVWASILSYTSLSLNWTLQQSSGSQVYNVTFKDGSLVITRSEIQNNNESNCQVTGTSFSDNPSDIIHDGNNADSGDKASEDSPFLTERRTKHNINWTDVTNIEPSLIPNDSVCTTVSIILIQGFQVMFFLGLGVMLGYCTAPIPIGLHLSLPYLSEVQLGFVAISFLLSALNVFRSRRLMSTELSYMTCYQLLVALVSVILQGLLTAGRLPFPVRVTPQIGGLAFFSIFNMGLVSDFIASNSQGHTCRIIVRALTLGSVILVTVAYCTLCQLRYKQAGVSFRATLIITAVHFVSQYGLFKCVIKYIRYIIGFSCQRKLGTLAEQILLVIYALIWLIPIFLFYETRADHSCPLFPNITNSTSPN